MPEGYHQLRWIRFDAIAESSITTGTTSNDGVTPSDTAISLTPVTVTPTQYRIVVSLSDMLLATNPLGLLEETVQEVGRVMAKKIDTEIQAVLDDGTNVIYGGADANTARDDISAAEVLRLSDINRAAARMQADNVPPVDGTYYVAVVHPNAAYDLRASTAAGSWLDVTKYTGDDRIMSGEIGRVFGVRVVMSSHLTTFTNAGSVTVYPTYVVGRGAYGVGFVQQPQVHITPNVSSDSDPAMQRRKIGAKCAFGTVILNQDALVRIESAATAA